MESLSNCIGQGRVTRCTDLKNTQTDHQSNFHAPGQRSFPQDTNHFCATLGGTVGFVSDSEMNAQCNFPGSQRLAHQMARPPHSRRHCLVDASYHQEPPDTHFLWEQFVNEFVLKAPTADLTVVWSTSHDSTQTEATKNQTALGIESSPHHDSRRMESVSVDQRTDAQGLKNHQEPHFELGVWTVM